MVEAYQGTANYFGNPTYRVLLKLSDILRQQTVMKYIRIEQRKSINFTIYPQTPALTNSNLAFRLSAVSATLGVNFAAPIALTRLAYANNIQTFSVTLNPGYYILRVTHAAQPVLTVSWQTDPYACIGDPNFVDYYGLFRGCTRSDN